MWSGRSEIVGDTDGSLLCGWLKLGLLASDSFGLVWLPSNDPRSCENWEDSAGGGDAGWERSRVSTLSISPDSWKDQEVTVVEL